MSNLITRTWNQLIQGFKPTAPPQNVLIIKGLSYQLSAEIKDDTLYVLSFKKEGDNLAVIVSEVGDA